MQVILIGGGISGLICAFRLRQAGVSVVLLEQSARVGGVIESVRQDDFQFELGPQSFLSNPTVLDLVTALNLEGELLRADSKAPRFIYWNGRLHPAPMAPPQLLSSPLLSAGTKFRLLTEALRRSSPPEGDESLAAFVRRKFGNDLLENLAGPFVSGIHAGDPEKLSVRAAFPFLHEWERQYGSVLKGAMKSRPPKGAPRPTLSSFRNGLTQLVQSLHAALGDCVRLETRVEAVLPAKSNGSSLLDVQVTRRGKSETLTAKSVVLATDTGAAARLLAAASPVAAGLLRTIEYAAVATVGVGYRRAQVGHCVDGFGFLVPRKEGLRVLGTVWCSSLFPGRAPQGMVNLTSFVGGATDARIRESSESEIAEQAEKEVAGVLNITGSPVTRVFRFWPRALPQYNLGHSEVISALQSEVATIPGLFLAGNYLSGASIGYCAEQACKTASAVQQYLAGN